MLIQIHSPETRLTIPIPTGLVFNRFTARFIPLALADSGVPVTADQAVRLVDIINRFRKTHPDWVLVDVQSADGERVRVKL